MANAVSVSSSVMKKINSARAEAGVNPNALPFQAEAGTKFPKEPLTLEKIKKLSADDLKPYFYVDSELYPQYESKGNTRKVTSSKTKQTYDAAEWKPIGERFEFSVDENL